MVFHGQNPDFWCSVFKLSESHADRRFECGLSKDCTVSSFSLTNRLGKVMKAPVRSTRVFLRVFFFLVLRHRFLYN